RTTSSSSSTLSLHDALPIFLAVDHVLVERVLHVQIGILSAVQAPLVRLVLRVEHRRRVLDEQVVVPWQRRVLARDHARAVRPFQDRKSTRLNSSHQLISYAV